MPNYRVIDSSMHKQWFGIAVNMRLNHVAAGALCSINNHWTGSVSEGKYSIMRFLVIPGESINNNCCTFQIFLNYQLTTQKIFGGTNCYWIMLYKWMLFSAPMPTNGVPFQNLQFTSFPLLFAHAVNFLLITDLIIRCRDLPILIRFSQALMWNTCTSADTSFINFMHQ